ncbi:MAG: ArsC family reductase [Cellvibrionaceae bacterium]
MITVYGIPNCDTVKKAKKWLEKQDINYSFHDFRKDGLTQKQVKTWIAEIGLDQLVNKRSTTWKTLPKKQQESFDEKSAVTLIVENPTLIKRPLIDNGKQKAVGFNEEKYLALFS